MTLTTEQRAALKEVAENPNITRTKWYAHYIPSQGWAICWKNGEDFIPIAVMRWTDGLRPEVEERLENECKFIAAFDPTTCLELLEEVERLREIEEQWNEAVGAGLIILDGEDGPEWRATDSVRNENTP